MKSYPVAKLANALCEPESTHVSKREAKLEVEGIEEGASQEPERTLKP